MPRIEIKELDLTQSTSAVGTDIPYIPGFAYAQKDADGKIITPNIPTLCTSLSIFERLFGDSPVEFTDEGLLNKFDTSYIMARELLALGMPVYYHALQFPNPEVKISFAEAKIQDNMIKYLNQTALDIANLRDLGEYSLKYITSGGYANYAITHTKDIKTFKSTLAIMMLEIAKERGDAIALIEDNYDNVTLDPKNTASFYHKINNDKDITDTLETFGAAFIGWGKYKLSKTYEIGNEKINTAVLPACFGYLAALALNIKSSPNWLAMAGTTRGLVPNLIELYTPINNAVANAYQPTKQTATDKRALNAITNIKPYGLCIWGNRTLRTIDEYELTATNFLNTRNMMSDIKKVAYRAAKAQLFEQNSEVLWLNFKAEVSPFLEQLKKGNGISDYKLLKLATKYNGQSLGKEEFACAIKIYPMYAVESFEITVVVSDNDVTVG